jgi:hypothetical protein
VFIDQLIPVFIQLCLPMCITTEFIKKGLHHKFHLQTQVIFEANKVACTLLFNLLDQISFQF